MSINQKRRFAALAAGSLLAASLVATSASGQTADSILANGRSHGTVPTQTFAPFGGSGDAQVEDRCPDGQYLTGLKYRAGDWFDQIQIACAAIAPGGAVGGRDYGPARGAGGGGMGEGGCAGYRVVSGMDYQLTGGNRQVSRIEFRCKATIGGDISTTVVSSPSAKTPGHAPPQYCPGNDAAIGMTIHYGKHVNAIGLICSGLYVPPGPPRKPLGKIIGGAVGGPH